MRRTTGMMILLAAMLGMAGCGRGGDGPQTYQVSGTVTLDNKPVEQGEILFRAANDDDKTYAGTINNGLFEFASTAGNKRVEISSMQKTEGQGSPGTPGDPIGPDNPADVYAEIIPAQYNANSTLEAEVKADGENKFTFDLNSSGS